MKIILVLGASGSGKTWWIEKEIIKGIPLESKRVFGVPVSVNDEKRLLLFGTYNISTRCKGCDTLSMDIIDRLVSCVKGLVLDGQYQTIVADGDRVNNKKMLDTLKKFIDYVEIVYLDTSLDVIYQRLPQCNKTFVMTTHTKTRNSVKKMLATGFKVTHIKSERKKWF
jgi:hypothetical protein